MNKYIIILLLFFYSPVPIFGAVLGTPYEQPSCSGTTSPSISINVIDKKIKVSGKNKKYEATILVKSNGGSSSCRDENNNFHYRKLFAIWKSNFGKLQLLENTNNFENSKILWSSSKLIGDIELSVIVGDGLGETLTKDIKILHSSFQEDLGSDIDYKIKISPLSANVDINKEFRYTVSFDRIFPAYDRTVTLKMSCYSNGKLTWQENDMTYDPGFKGDDTWWYRPGSYGLHRCDAFLEVDGDINPSDNYASIEINVPIPDKKDIYLESASVSKYYDIMPGEYVDINIMQKFSGITPNHFVSQLGYFLSKDQYYNSDDTLLATDRSGLKNEEPFDNESARWKVPQGQAAGTYYILLVADYLKEHPETNENNNVHAIKVTIKENSVPDLRISNAELHEAQIELGSDSAITIQIDNIGSKESGNGTVKFYRSNDPTISASDTYVSSSSFSSIAPSKHIRIYRGLNGPASIGSYWYGACVVPVSGEANTNNNCSSGMKVTVTESKPELSISSLSITSTVQKDQNTNANIVIANTGSKASDSTSVAVYVSDDNIAGVEYTNVGQFSVPDIAANSKKTINGAVKFPISGSKWVFACVRPVDSEKDRTLSSNCSIPKNITITDPVSAQTAKITSPVNNSTLNSSAVTFRWNNVGADNYYIYVGSAELKADIYSGYMPGSTTSKTVSNLPSDGSKIYVTLWTRSNNKWKYEKFTYTAKSSSNPFIEKFYNEFVSYFGSKSGENYSCGTNMVCQNFSGGWNSLSKTIRVRTSDNYLYWKVGNGNWNNAGVRY